YESTLRGIDAEGHVAAVTHCPVGVDAEWGGISSAPASSPSSTRWACSTRGKKINVGVVRPGGCRGRV
ncbi:hypothetical protein B0H16DRAFT_1617297, partial [Mycena metata]